MKKFHFLKRWLYPDNRPGRIASALNRAWAIAASRGFAPKIVAALEVRGWKTGKITSFPIVPALHEGERYAVSMLGEDVRWVRNVRAANGKAILKTGVDEHVLLEEVPPARRAPILKAYLQQAPGARPHVAVDKDAPSVEFERVAGDYPVFHIVSKRRGAE